MNLSDTPLSEVEIRAALREALAHLKEGRHAGGVHRGAAGVLRRLPEGVPSVRLRRVRQLRARLRPARRGRAGESESWVYRGDMFFYRRIFPLVYKYGYKIIF